MQEQEYLNMFAEEEFHWWYVGMRRITRTILPLESLPQSPRVLDAGCGTGYNLRWLNQQYGAWVTGLDFSPQALDFCRRRGQRTLVRASAVSLPFPGGVYDLVTCFDVLTHLNDASARSHALREFRRVLKPGGHLLLRVPAYKFLWSGHDDAIMAHHRYGKEELRNTATGAGFEVVRLTAANSILFPFAALWRLLKKTRIAPAGSDVGATTRGGNSLNRVFTFILRLEASYLCRHDMPWGLSFFLLARKPGTSPRPILVPGSQELGHKAAVPFSRL